MSTFTAPWAALSAALNKIKDGYLRVVDWVDDNPQKSLWIASGLIIGALVI